MPGSWKVPSFAIYMLVSFPGLNPDDFLIKPDEGKVRVLYLRSLSLAVLL